LSWLEDLVIALLWLKWCAIIDGVESKCVNGNKGGFFETPEFRNEMRWGDKRVVAADSATQKKK
jgi:hypothetical protein